MSYISSSGEIEAITDAPRFAEVAPTDLKIGSMLEGRSDDLCNVLNNFPKVLNGPSRVSAVEFTIKTNGDLSKVRGRPFPLNPKRREAVAAELLKLIDQGVIEPSESPVTSPVFVVPKKSDEWRLVVDFRKLNAITIADRYFPPKIDELLTDLKGARFFTTLDLAQGFHQIPIKEKDRYLTAIATPLGTFQYRMMPFGVKNAPSCFQRLMDQVLEGCSDFAKVYIDDCLIFSKTAEEHLAHLTRVLERFDKFGLVLRLTKCFFGEREIQYLGHLVNAEGVKPASDNLRKILEHKVPANLKELRSFLGLVGFYRKFINRFSDITKPLNELVKKNTHFVMGDKQVAAYRKLVEALTSQELLVHPDWSEEFVLTCDASNTAVAGVLSQKHGVIGFASKTLIPAEVKYSAWERECLAIITMINHFQYYLGSTRFRIVTDSQPIVKLRKNLDQDKHGRLHRWLMLLENYECELQHIPGPSNVVADFLSRLETFGSGKGEEFVEEVNQVDESESEEDGDDSPEASSLWGIGIDPVSFRARQDLDPDLSEATFDPTVITADNRYKTVIKQIRLDEYGVWTFLGKWIIPWSDRELTIKRIHRSTPNSHRKVKATKRAVATHYWCIELPEIVAKVCQDCPECQLATKAGGLRVPLQLPQKYDLFEKIQMDFIGPFPKSKEGYTYALVVVCVTTRFVIAEATKSKQAAEVAKVLRTRVFPLFGVPRLVQTDNEKSLAGGLMKVISELTGFQHDTIHEFNPKANGVVERHNGVVKNTLLKLLGPHTSKTEWANFLQDAVWQTRASVNSSTGLTPQHMTFGKRLRDFESPWLGGEDLKGSFTRDAGAVAELQAYFDQAARFREIGANNALHASRTNRNRTFPSAVSPPLKVGDLVKKKEERWLSFLHPWTGPYKVTKVNWPTVATMETIGREGETFNCVIDKLERWSGPPAQTKCPEKISPKRNRTASPEPSTRRKKRRRN